MGPESRIQKAVVEYARKGYRGRLLARKFTSGKYGSNGWPDYDFFTEDGGLFMIEFKAAGGELSPLQKERIKELRRMGHRVYVTDAIEEGKTILYAEMDGGPPVVAKLYAENVRRFPV